MPTFSFRNIATGLKTELTGATPFDVSGLLPNGTYAVRSLSEEAATTLTVNVVVATVPGRVSDLAVVPGDGQNTLSWSAPASGGAAIADYRIDVDSGAGFVTISDGIGSVPGFVHEGLTNDTSYGYRVAAVNSEGAGQASAVVTGTPTGVSPLAEPDARGHWLLGADNATHGDLLTGQALVPQKQAPGLQPGHISISGRGNGLLSQVTDTADVTFCAVVRRPAGTTGSMIGGVLAPASTGVADGWAAFTRDVDDTWVRNQSGGGTVELDNTSPIDQFFFIAVSLRADGSHVYFRGGAAGNLVDEGNTGRGAARGVNIALGDVYYDTAAFSGRIDVAELILWQSAKTRSEIEAIFLRSRDRLADRGIALLAP